MNYWLHRNTGGDNASPYTQPLLDKGYLSIGWKGLSNDKNKDEIKVHGRPAVDKLLSENGWELRRNRYCLSRFVEEMKMGDIIIVPSPGVFSIYEVEDNEVYSNESINTNLFTDVNGILASRQENDGYFTFINNQGKEIDLGFYRKVKPRAINISRYCNMDPALYAKLRTLMTNICISDVGSAVDNFLNHKGTEENNPITSDLGSIAVDSPQRQKYLISKDDIKIIPTIANVETLFGLKLSIPIYQRPYVWTTENVELMLSDIRKSMDQGKQSYRLGSVILNDNQIVDGQQRITTLALIRRAFHHIYKTLGEDECELTYNNVLSFNHIRENYEFIKSWLNKLHDISSFEEYLNKNCECIVLSITGNDGLSLAFKLFDSQNGRGKPLEAYNLLKAFHLRAMQNHPSEDQIQCDRTWEQATRFSKSHEETKTYDILKHLFDEQLYRARIWSRNRSAWGFGKKQISEFKGMYIDKYHKPEYPFQNQQMLFYMTEKFYQGFLSSTMPTRSRFTDNDDDNISPFTNISQNIVNGKEFFEYIRTYVELYKRLFIELDTYQLREFKQFYKTNCLEYNGHWRIGDTYVREMYKTIVLYIFDKFGEEILNHYYKILYLLTYIVRRKNEKVFYQTVAKYPQELFSIIYNAKSEYDLRLLKDKIIWSVDGGYSAFTQYENVVADLKTNTKWTK